MMSPAAPHDSDAGGIDRSWDARRRLMVASDIAGRGIVDERVLRAMAVVPRERFAIDEEIQNSLQDRPLSIGHGQTMSQPYVTALMSEAAQIVETDRVLEVGTGSGYGAAVLATLAAEVWTVERIGGLAISAVGRLHDLGYDNVTCVHADGTKGLAEAAPFDVIVVPAGCKRAPRPLLDQLADGGRLIMPIGPHAFDQVLTRVTAEDGDLIEESLAPVRFVPLVSGLA